MSTAVATSPLFIEGGDRYIAHIIRLKDIPAEIRASMSEVWDALMDLNRFNDTLLPDQLTDRFLAQYLGRSERFVQKGLHGLEGKHEKFPGKPVIRRHTKFGRRNIEIIGRIAGRKEREKGQAPVPPRPGQKRTGPAPGPPSKPTTPEQLAAAAAAANPPPAAEPDDVLPGETPADYLRRKLADALRARPAVAPPPPPRPMAAPRRRINLGPDPRSPEFLAIQAELEAKKDHPARE